MARKSKTAVLDKPEKFVSMKSVTPPYTGGVGEIHGGAVSDGPAPEVGQGPEVVKPEAVLTQEQKDVAESRKVLAHPVGAGQRFFESPEGFIEIGEADRGRVFCRKANKGAGMWINPMR